MKLLLTSNGISNKSLEQTLRDLVGKDFKETVIVFIPTAANFEKGDKSWVINDLVNLKRLEPKILDIVDIAALKQEEWKPRIGIADILVFGGGNDSYLMFHLKKSGLDKELLELLKTKVYVGISAGSIVTTQKLPNDLIHDLYYDDFLTYKEKDGLGLVTFKILPHLNSAFFPNIVDSHLKTILGSQSETFYALDDNSGVKVTDNQVEVVSEGQWVKYN